MFSQKGCILQPPAGFGSQPGVFVGSTTTGIKVFAGLGLIYPSFTNGVYILTGTTSFTLSSFQDSSAGNLAAGDLNKDGNGDLVILDSASANTGRVTVMLGNSDGTFKNGVTYPIAGNYSVAAAIDDVNGDGNLDIVAVSGDQQISVLLGNGDGTFQTAQSFAAPSLPRLYQRGFHADCRPDYRGFARHRQKGHHLLERPGALRQRQRHFYGCRALQRFPIL